MSDDSKKVFGLAIVFLEVLLAGCLVLLAFIYGIWISEAELSSTPESVRSIWLEAAKRQLGITIAALLAGWFVHSLNTYWIARTALGNIKNSLVFARGVFIMIFLSGLAGVVLFVLDRNYR